MIYCLQYRRIIEDRPHFAGFMSETLGTFEQAVLLAIVRLRDDAYGRAILREVQERLEREVVARRCACHARTAGR